MEGIGKQILINSTHMTHRDMEDTYEFILDEQMALVECVRLEHTEQNGVRSIKDLKTALDGKLFELNHVRVNPKVDNSFIIGKLTNTLNQIGVRVSNQPRSNSMAVCYKPLGEISHNVRFYLNEEGKLVFLSPATRPRLVYSKPKV